MRFFFYRATVLFQAVLAFALVNGCQASSHSSDLPQQLASARAPSAATLQSQQLIIKFKRAAVTCDRAGIARFSELAGVALELVRPMSGEACVVTQFADNAAGLARGLDLLRKSAAVEWVEPDAVMRTQ
jgi:hypothetical protein